MNKLKDYDLSKFDTLELANYRPGLDMDIGVADCCEYVDSPTDIILITKRYKNGSCRGFYLGTNKKTFLGSNFPACLTKTGKLLLGAVEPDKT